MTDNKRDDDDDLFEDLDKFFAPIKDVEWDEPADAGEAQTPVEEHVTVHAGPPASGSAAASSFEPEPPTEPASPSMEDVPAPEELDEGEDEEEEEEEEEEDDEGAWYDTGVIDTIAEGELEDEESADETEEDLVRIVDEQAIPNDEVEEDAEQADLFAKAQADPELEQHAEIGDEPSEAEMEAATEHFGGAVRVMPFGDEEDESLSELVRDDEGGEGSGPEDEPAEELVSSGTRTITVGSQGLGGPSWQEPASVEVGAELERRGPNADERDVPAAFLTGIVLAGGSLLALLAGKPVFAFVATLVALWAQGELFGVMVHHRHQPATAVGLVSGALIMGAAYFHGESAMLAMFALGTVATFLWFMSVPGPHRHNTIEGIGLTLMNMAWIPILAGYLLVTLTLTDGVRLVVAVIGLTFVFDAAAFLVGQVWGGSVFHRALAPSTSPRKSLEGTLGATLVTVIFGAALVPSFVDSFQNKRVDALLLALVVAAAATFGDLAESLVKRDFEVKDMGNVLPGHGGVLDRIDSLLFVAPAAFLLFRIVLG